MTAAARWLLLTVLLLLPQTQTVPCCTPGGVVALGTIAGTGPLAVRVSYMLEPSSASTFSVTWGDDGTKPAACTLEAEGSADGVHWVAMQDVGVAPSDCTATGAVSYATKPMAYARVNVMTYAAGDQTTVVSVYYVRGR